MVRRSLFAGIPDTTTVADKKRLVRTFVRRMELDPNKKEVKVSFYLDLTRIVLVSGAGLEPARCSPYAPQTYASANSAIPTRSSIDASPIIKGRRCHVNDRETYVTAAFQPIPLVLQTMPAGRSRSPGTSRYSTAGPAPGSAVGSAGGPASGPAPGSAPGTGSAPAIAASIGCR